VAKRNIRVRSKRLAQIDESKMWLALYLMARDVVEDKTTSPPAKTSPPKQTPSQWRA
jgi:hypothetical protein